MNMKAIRSVFSKPVLAAALSVVASTTASAQNQSVATTSLADLLSVGYYGYFAGPSVTRLGGSVAPDITGTNSDAVNHYNNLEVAIKTGEGARAFVQGRFLLQPVQGEAFFTLLDPRIGYGFSVAKAGDFSLGANALLEPNVSSNTSRITGVRVSLNPTYNPSGTRWSFEAGSFATYYIHGSNLSLADNRWHVYSAPAATYMVSKNLGARLYFEAINVRGKVNGSSGALVDTMNIQPRLTWDVTKSLNVQPYLKFFPARLSFDNTSVGIEINGTIL